MGTEDPLEENEPVTEPTTVTAPDTVSREEFQSAIATMDQNMGKALGQVTEQIKSLQPTQTEPVTEPSSDDSEVQKLVDSPTGFVDERIKLQMAKLGPYFQNQITDKYNDLVNREIVNFESLYGEGSFNKFIQPGLDEMGENLTPEMRSSAESMKHLIDNIKGRNMNELFEARNEHIKKVQQKEMEDNVPVMLRGGMAGPKPGKLSAAEQEFVNKYENATGRKLDIKGELDFRDKMPQEAQMTLTDYIEMTKEAK